MGAMRMKRMRIHTPYITTSILDNNFYYFAYRGRECAGEGIDA
jgi:hypothetical protein